MIGNIKFKYIESLKNMRAEEYDYNKFLSDSSDDFPKYADGLEEVEEIEDSVKYKQVDDYWVYANTFNSGNG